MPQKKQMQNLSFQTRKRQENGRCALSFSRLRRQLPLGGSLCLCVFFLCAAEKTETKIKPSKPKICTLFFCGRAVGHYMPSSGRKVSRVSVTKGARGTEKQQKATILRCFQVDPSPASRQPPLPQGNFELGRFSAVCRRKNKCRI